MPSGSGSGSGTTSGTGSGGPAEDVGGLRGELGRDLGLGDDLEASEAAVNGPSRVLLSGCGDRRCMGGERGPRELGLGGLGDDLEAPGCTLYESSPVLGSSGDRECWMGDSSCPV